MKRYNTFGTMQKCEISCHGAVDTIVMRGSKAWTSNAPALGHGAQQHDGRVGGISHHDTWKDVHSLSGVWYCRAGCSPVEMDERVIGTERDPKVSKSIAS